MSNQNLNIVYVFSCYSYTVEWLLYKETLIWNRYYFILGYLACFVSRVIILERAHLHFGFMPAEWLRGIIILEKLFWSISASEALQTICVTKGSPELHKLLIEVFELKGFNTIWSNIWINYL